MYFIFAVIIFIILCGYIFFYIKKRNNFNVICKDNDKNKIDLDNIENYKYTNLNIKENESINIIDFNKKENILSTLTDNKGIEQNKYYEHKEHNKHHKHNKHIEHLNIMK